MLEVVCGVITNSQGQYLACLRPDGKHLGGLWEFPGGKVDEGENPTEALIRELREELSVAVTVGRPLSPVEWDYDGNWIRLLPFCCEISAGELVAVEHAALRWCFPSQFDELDWAEADRPILQEISRFVD